jgi:hypothetical protein
MSGKEGQDDKGSTCEMEIKMSAWIVSKKHIDLLVTLAAQYELMDGKTEQQFGQILWDENYRSVNSRYDDNESPRQYEFTPYPVETLSTIAQIKQARCYIYQTCETDDYAQTVAIMFAETLATILEQEGNFYIPSGKSVRDLPGWESAPWGI